MKYYFFSLVAVAVLTLSDIPQKHTGVIKGFPVIPSIEDSVKIELEKTVITNMPVLYIKDTASSTEKIQEVLGKGYGELMQFMQGNKLQPQKFMAWYYTMQPPWIMDVAVHATNLPAQTNGRIQSRVVEGGEVLIAHMWGPYDQVGKAYTKIENWLKENNRKAKSAAFEVYLNDPAEGKSPLEIRTDVYQPLEK